MCPSCQVAIWKAWPDPRGPPSRQPSQSTNRDPCSVAWGAWAKTCIRSPLNRTMTLILKGGATGLGMPNNKSQVAKKDQKESKTGTEISRDSSQSHFIQICYHQIPPFRPNAFDSKAAGIGKGLKGCPWKLQENAGICLKCLEIVVVLGYLRGTSCQWEDCGQCSVRQQSKFTLLLSRSLDCAVGVI